MTRVQVLVLFLLLVLVWIHGLETGYLEAEREPFKPTPRPSQDSCK